MRGITNSNTLATIRDALATYSTDVGAEVSDNKWYQVEVTDTVIPETDLVAFGLHFPEDVIGLSSDSAKLTINGFNEYLDETGYMRRLELNSSVYGQNLIYEGLKSHPYFTHVLIVRVVDKA